MELLAQASIFSSTQYWILLSCGLLFGFYMAWSIGANDVANAMGTSVGSKALTLTQAIVVAGILEFVGAFLVGPHVSATIRKEIIPVNELQAILQADGASYYVYGMLSALLAAAVWLMIATFYGLPVSTTHSIVGAVLGFGVVVLWGHLEVINWGKVGGIVTSWVVSPLSSGLLAFVVFSLVQRLVLLQRDMVEAAKRVAPFLVFAVFEVITLVTLWKGLKHLKLPLSDVQSILLATVLSVVFALLSVPLIRRVKVVRVAGNPAPKTQNPIISEDLVKIQRRVKKLAEIAHGEAKERLEKLKGDVDGIQASVKASHDVEVDPMGTPEIRATERIFAYLQIISACAVAFAHGANDVANAVGPLGGVIAVLDSGGAELGKAVSLDQTWLLGILAIGGLGIVVGLATWGWRVIETIGKKITELTPTRGFSAEFGAAATILIASRSGMPISTTHTLVGAVLGVGFARGIGALNLRVVRDIIISWIVTLPAGAALAILFFFILRGLFG